ncbi:glycosyltransferase [Halobellus salinisoli]|uniref:glycosyltransferase n=1 Tax=Halobellus salinisoli TaxID=3108500 RepID=UPI00300A3DFD
MPPTVAVAHYPEGAGHATRMLAIAKAIESAGGSVRMAGGGAGTEFVALNGFDEFEPTNVDYIDTYQNGSLWQTAKRSLPASLSRIADYQAWLSATEPDALVTDDMFAAMAANRCDVPLYVLKHDMPGLYDDFTERAGARFHTLFQLATAREFFYPVVWPESPVDPAQATRIPPVALDGHSPIQDSADVVVVPSHYSSLSRVSEHLRRQGYDVLNVADEDWDPVQSLLPYIRGADVVVCSGYSTIMDAAVAGTPCIVHPATDEQDAVADCLARFDVGGFTVAPDPIDVLDAVADPPSDPAFSNGATFIARHVLLDLEDPDPYAIPHADESPEVGPDIAESSKLRSIATVPAVAAAGVIATTSVVAPSRLGRKISSIASRVSDAGQRLRNQTEGAGRRLARVVGDGVRIAAGGCRGLARQCRRALSGRLSRS